MHMGCEKRKLNAVLAKLHLLMFPSGLLGAVEQDSARIPRECFEEADHGSCLVKSPKIRYRYDPRSNTCRSFYFHDCGGNNNRFESMQECMNHCAL